MHDQAWLNVIAILGFATHFVTRWGEYRRAAEKIGPIDYVMADPPAWIAAGLGTLSAVLIVPDIGAVLATFQIPAPLYDKLLAAMRFVYWIAGYFGSSLLAKAPGMLFPSIANPTHR